ncbi:MAG: hypothetical protein HY293_04895 [Planctomycetes bacterium]|nr:hypothetical protein [Planctomycetota bacterium]
MADLLIHFASGFAAARPLRDGRLRSIVYVGVCLPDLLYKGLLYLGGTPNWLVEPTHSPLGLVAYCYLLALLFEEEWRRRAFGALLGGAWLHVLFDLGKDYLGSGVILWAFPFSMQTVELGWYRNEDTIYWMPAALALIGLVELAWRLVRARGRAGP